LERGGGDHRSQSLGEQFADIGEAAGSGGVEDGESAVSRLYLGHESSFLCDFSDLWDFFRAFF
jgi:hypothetical protein